MLRYTADAHMPHSTTREYKIRDRKKDPFGYAPSIDTRSQAGGRRAVPEVAPGPRSVAEFIRQYFLALPLAGLAAAMSGGTIGMYASAAPPMPTTLSTLL